MQYSGVASPMLAAADFMDAKIQPIAPPYSDQQTPSPICGATLGMNSSQNPAALSLSQGGTFTNLFPAQRGGRMTPRGHRKVHITRRKSLKQRGGAAAYPDAFGARLPADLVDLSRTAGLDKALADLPQFTGTYGLQTGGRRNRKNSRKANRKNRKNSRKANRKNSRKANRKNSRKANRKNRKNSRKANRKNSRKASRKQRGGAYGDEAMSVADSSKLLLSPEMERFAFVNPQFYNENVVNPNFVAPYSAYIASQK
jgi:hypothetical protein